MDADHVTESAPADQPPKRKWAASSRRKAEKRKAASLCVGCGKARDNETLRCDACRAKMKIRSDRATERARAARPPKPTPLTADRPAYKREWRAKRKASGVCTTCGGVRDVPGKVRCGACQSKDQADYRREGRARYQRRAERVNGELKAKRAAWEASGVCNWCGGNKEDPKRKRCRACHDRIRASLKKRRLRRIAAGRCPKCGHDRDSGRLVCTSCLEKGKREYQKLMATNPDSLRLKTWRRRTRLVDNGGTLTVEEWKAIKEAYDHRCLKCGRREPEIKLTMDHVLPVNMGGKTEAVNSQPLCESCNKSKRDRHIDYRPKTTA